MTFFDGKLQRVVARSNAWLATHAAVPWFVHGRVDDGSPYACLYKNGIDVTLMLKEDKSGKSFDGRKEWGKIEKLAKSGDTIIFKDVSTSFCYRFFFLYVIN